MVSSSSSDLSRFQFSISESEASPSQLICEFQASPPPLRVLSFKGGAARVFLYRAFLQYAHENGILPYIEEIGGSSAGSVAAIFSSIHYEESEDRIAALDKITEANFFDPYDDSFGWRAYRFVTAPVNWISKGLGWLGKTIRGVGERVAQLPVIGKTPVNRLFGLVGSVVNACASIISPKTYARIFNLVTGGGMYHGNYLQKSLQEQIQEGVQAGVDAVLALNDNKAKYQQQLIDIGLLAMRDGKMRVTPDVSFCHLDVLSKIPGSEFKRCYITGVRWEDQQLVVFNAENSPDMPLHLAGRIAMSFPSMWRRVFHNGYHFVDGGVFNNAPVELASHKKLTAIEERHGITDKLARLNIRVEYPDEYQYHLWRKRPEPGRWQKMKDAVFKTFVQYVLLRGMDPFSADDEVTRRMQEDYPQRTLQLPDFEFGHLDFDRIVAERDHWCEKVKENIDDYFKNHAGELLIKRYACPTKDHPETDMPHDLQECLLAYLQDEKHPTNEVIHISEKSHEVQEAIRQGLIKHLSAATQHSTFGSTVAIAKEMKVDLEEPSLPAESLPLPAADEYVVASEVGQVLALPRP